MKALRTRLLTAGFTSPEKKLKDLEQGDFKQITSILNDRESKAFASENMASRIATLVALVMSRNKKDGDKLQSLTDFSKDFEASRTSDYGLQAMERESFLLLVSQAAKQDEAAFLSIVANMISSLKRVDPASKFKNDSQGLIDSLYLTQLRKILVGVIEDSQSSNFLRDQCIRLLFYVGLVYASG